MGLRKGFSKLKSLFVNRGEEKWAQKAEPSLKKESPNLEICLLFITLISKNLAGLSVQTVMN